MAGHTRAKIWMSDLYQMTVTGPEDQDETVKKGPGEAIFAEEKALIEDFIRQGFTIRKHTVGFSGRHPIRALDVSCEIRKLPS